MVEIRRRKFKLKGSIRAFEFDWVDDGRLPMGQIVIAGPDDRYHPEFVTFYRGELVELYESVSNFRAKMKELVDADLTGGREHTWRFDGMLKLVATRYYMHSSISLYSPDKIFLVASFDGAKLIDQLQAALQDFLTRS